MSGKPKPRRFATCHPEKTYYAKGYCQACYMTHLRRTKPSVVAYMKDYLRKYNRENKDILTEKRRQERLTWSQEKRAAVKRRQRSNAYRLKYGITLDEAFAILHAQGGCGICGKALTERQMRVDHCHATGIVRGILCNTCNTALGYLGDTQDAIDRAARYIAGSAAKTDAINKVIGAKS